MSAVAAISAVVLLVPIFAPVVVFVVYAALWVVAILTPGHKRWMCRVGAHAVDPNPRHTGVCWTWVRCPACGAEDIA